MLTVAPGPLRPWFAPERPGPLVFEHVARTGHGRVRVDRWPDPRVVVAELPGNLSLRGDPRHLPPDALDGFTGCVDAPPEWLPAIRASVPGAAPWDRVILTLPDTAPEPRLDPRVRLLTSDDLAAFPELGAECDWIGESYGGVPGLLAAGVGRGVLVDGHVAAVAVPFYVGGTYEDIGVITLPAYRRQGLSTACAGAVVTDVRSRGRIPSWSTSADNLASLGVAARLGFVPAREDVLYVLRTAIPAPPG